MNFIREIELQQIISVNIRIVTKKEMITEISPLNKYCSCKKSSTVRCRYNAVNFLPNPHNRHPIA